MVKKAQISSVNIFQSGYADKSRHGLPLNLKRNPTKKASLWALSHSVLGNLPKPHLPILLAVVWCYRVTYVRDMADITVHPARAPHIYLEKNCRTADADNLECSLVCIMLCSITYLTKTAMQFSQCTEIRYFSNFAKKDSHTNQRKFLFYCNKIWLWVRV